MLGSTGPARAAFGGMTMRNSHKAALLGFCVCAAAVPLLFPSGASGSSASPTPIQHVVVILQENHSFDNVLGQLCIQDQRACNAASSGLRLDGSTIQLGRATDIVPIVNHVQKSQVDAIDGGKMDGWEKINGCQKDQCYVQFDPTQIPSMAAMARSGAISDNFFSRDIVPSWGGHLDFFAQTLDGFVGNNPQKKAGTTLPGWGCDSGLDTQWVSPVTHQMSYEPTCVPDKSGNGPYRPSPVSYVPTFGDRLDAAGRTWGIYGVTKADKGANLFGYRWMICPMFAECLNGPQAKNMHEASQLFTDAANGTLPNFSILIPNGATGATSQHNGRSMIYGDNYIGAEVAAIQNGPDAATTTIFIYYDDCGCFYDHVPPPAGLGIRLPLVIVSPYAKVGYTDHTLATNSSILAYTEHVLSVSPLNQQDATAYDLSNSFDYTQTPTKSFTFHPAKLPTSSIHYLETHTPQPDNT
jgi:phospholipase C